MADNQNYKIPSMSRALLNLEKSNNDLIVSKGRRTVLTNLQLDRLLHLREHFWTFMVILTFVVDML